jgi:hypothetical protein
MLDILAPVLGVYGVRCTAKVKISTVVLQSVECIYIMYIFTTFSSQLCIDVLRPSLSKDIVHVAT